MLEILLNDTGMDRFLCGLDVDKFELGLCVEKCRPRKDDFDYLREKKVALELYAGSCDVFGTRGSNI